MTYSGTYSALRNKYEIFPSNQLKLFYKKCWYFNAWTIFSFSTDSNLILVSCGCMQHSFFKESYVSSILWARESYSVCSIAHSSSQSSQYVVKYMRILHNFTRYFYAKKYNRLLNYCVAHTVVCFFVLLLNFDKTKEMKD